MNIFPTKVGVYLSSNDFNTHLKQMCFDIIHNDRNSVKRPSEYLTHYFDPSLGMSLVDVDGFDAFHTWIRACSVDYINNVLGYVCDNVLVTECWLNRCDRGGWQDPHNHGNAFISGTYFVNFKDGHAPLRFMKIPVSGEPYITLKENDTRKREAIVEHGEGTLLLWESHLPHGYVDNQENDRVTISFNIMPEIVSTSHGSYGFKVIRVKSEQNISQSIA